MAGLDWQGRNLLLITPQYGSRVRLVTVLTTAPLNNVSEIVQLTENKGIF